MPELKLKSIPSPSNLPPEVQAFAFPVKEAIDLLLGRIGDGKDAAVTRRNAGQVLGGTTIINTGTATGGGYVPDLTAPPAPTGLVATPGFSVINLEWDDAPYTVGHGHAYTAVYRSSDSLRGNAEMIGFTPGTIYVDSVGSSAGPFYYWIRYVTRDGVMGPWNAVSGVSASTATDPTYLLGLLAGNITEASLKTEVIGGKDAFVFNAKTFAIKYSGTGYVPFIVQVAPTTINGHVIPPGVYLDEAFMRRFVAQSGQIGNLAVDDAAIANVSAAKLTIGDGTVGGSLKSTYFASGVAGWKINPDGTAEFNNVLVHGTVYADSGYFKGTLIGGAASTFSSGTGLWAGYDSSTYKARIGTATGSRMEWNGSALTIYGAGGQVLLSSGSGIPWGQITGTIGPAVNRIYNSSAHPTQPNDDGWSVWTNAGSGFSGSEAEKGHVLPSFGSFAMPTGSARFLHAVGAVVAGRELEWNVHPQQVQVLPGTRVEAHALTGAQRCTAAVCINWYDGSGGLTQVTVGSNVSEAPGGTVLSNWKKTGGFAVAPAGTKWMSLVIKLKDMTGADAYVFCDQAFLGEAASGQSILSPWSDGARVITNTNQITDGAGLGTTANWGGVTGSGKPADNATVGAVIGTNLGGTFDTTNIGVYMPGAAIGNAQIDRGTANKIKIIEADIETASVSTLKIKGNSVNVPAYVESIGGPLSVDSYVQWLGTSGLPFDDAGRAMLTLSMIAYASHNTSGYNVTCHAKFEVYGVRDLDGATFTYSKEKFLGDFVSSQSGSSTTTTSFDLPFKGTYYFRAYLRLLFGGGTQTLTIQSISMSITGIMR